jgi:hypothetical protein
LVLHHNQRAIPARRLTTASDEGSRQGWPDPHDRLGDNPGLSSIAELADPHERFRL